MRFHDSTPPEMLETTLLFSVDGQTATEVTIRGIEFAQDVDPLFEGTFVTKPVPVMAEGNYTILDPATKQYRQVVITAEDIAAYFENTPRDVAINYEHRRGGTAKGWVRLKDTGRLGTIKTSKGEKAALFANLELFDQSAADVRSGYFRDVSIELKPVSKEIIGLALTATPVMRDLQFYSNAIADVDAASQEVEPLAAVENTPAAAESEGLKDPDSPPIDKETHMPDIDKNALFAEMLQEFGLTPDDLTAIPALVEGARAAQAQARLVTARETVRQFSTREDGSTVLAPAGVDVAAQLLVFAQDHAELQFSVEGESKSPEQLIEVLFSHLQAVQIYGESAGENPENFSTEPPATPDPESVLDDDRVNSIVARMKATFPRQAKA